MARDVAQRDQDQANFRIQNLGNPTALNDATKTDNLTPPRPNEGSGSAGNSLLAAPADHVHPAAPGGEGGPGVEILTLTDPSEQEQTGPDETVVAEFAVDFGAFDRNHLEIHFSATVLVDVGTANFRVRIGAAPDIIVGPVLASFSTTSNTFEVKGVVSAPFDASSIVELVKITAAADDAAATCKIKSKSVIFKTVA